MKKNIANNFTWDTVQDLVQALSPGDGQDGYALVADSNADNGLSFQPVSGAGASNQQIKQIWQANNPGKSDADFVTWLQLTASQVSGNSAATAASTQASLAGSQTASQTASQAGSASNSLSISLLNSTNGSIASSGVSSTSASNSTSQSQSTSLGISQAANIATSQSASTSLSQSSSASLSTAQATYNPNFSGLKTNNAVYNPGDTVTLSLQPQATSGTLKVEYFNNHQLIRTDNVSFTGAVSLNWTVPNSDDMQYLIKVTNNTVPGKTYADTVAVNVATNPMKFPIMGFLSKYYQGDGVKDSSGNYPNTQSISDASQNTVLDYLQRLHVNVIQAYDAYDKFEKPVPEDANGNPQNMWLDLANRPVFYNTLKGYIDKAHSRNQKVLLYDLMYGLSNPNQQGGLTAEMYLYWTYTPNFNASHVYGPSQLPVPPFKQYYIYLLNYLNANAKAFYFSGIDAVYRHLNFDGWHIDTLGNISSRVNLWGFEAAYPWDSPTALSGYTSYPNDVKARWGDKITGVNNVSGYGYNQTVAANVDYRYSETWSSIAGGSVNTYDDMLQNILTLQKTSDKGGLVIPAYVHKGASVTPGVTTFNVDAVKMLNNVIMAGGATHLEMGEHMLSQEYFPNADVGMTTTLKNYLPKQYDFMVAYHSLLAIQNPTADINLVNQASTHGHVTKGQVSIIENATDSVTVASLLNTVNLTTDSWVDGNFTQNIGGPITNAKITVGANRTSVYYATIEDPTPVKLTQNPDGTYTVPIIANYSLVWAV